MSHAMGELHFFCGKIAAGKSTLAQQLSEPSTTILISEDDWLGALFADSMSTAADYVECATRLRTAMAPHVAGLLKSGLSVVLDFPANTVDQRKWFRSILDQTGAPHCLHVMLATDEICLARLRDRNASGAHPFKVTETLFHQITKHLVLPSPDEGFNIMRHELSI